MIAARATFVAMIARLKQRVAEVLIAEIG